MLEAQRRKQFANSHYAAPPRPWLEPPTSWVTSPTSEPSARIHCATALRQSIMESGQRYPRTVPRHLPPGHLSPSRNHNCGHVLPWLRSKLRVIRLLFWVTVEAVRVMVRIKEGSQPPNWTELQADYKHDRRVSRGCRFGRVVGSWWCWSATSCFTSLILRNHYTSGLQTRQTDTGP